MWLCDDASRNPITCHGLSQMGRVLPRAESTTGCSHPCPCPGLATRATGLGKDSGTVLGSQWASFIKAQCKAAAVAAPVSPKAARREGDGGKRQGSSDERQEEGRALLHPGKETPVVEAVGLSLQHRFFTCEKRSKTIRHIKETFSKVREPLAWDKATVPGKAGDLITGFNSEQRMEPT